MEPRPVAVLSKMSVTTTASRSMFTNWRALGPPKNPATAVTSIAITATTARYCTAAMRDTAQPTTAAAGNTNTKMPSTNHSVRVGVPLISMVCLPVSATTIAEHTIITANAASAGADRDTTRRTRAPGRSTAGNPWNRNHRSAAARWCVSGTLMRSHREHPDMQPALVGDPRGAR